MRQRNNLLALVLLALFAAMGVGYFHVFVEPEKPFGIILFVGEGLVASKLTAARLYDGGAGHRSAIASLPHLALLNTSAADFAVPDSAAAASALACGAKVNNRVLSITPALERPRTLLELASRRGREVGLVTNGCLTDPTPGAFYAHSLDARERDALADELIAGRLCQVVLGGGAADFLPPAYGGRRHDNSDLLQSFVHQPRAHAIVRTAADLQAVATWSSERLLGVFSADAMAFGDQTEASEAAQPSLSDMVSAALESLQRNPRGYLLVVDAGLVERASLANQGERVLQELVELDRAVGIALEYAGPRGLVVVAGGQSTGGMALNGYPLREDRGVSLVGSINAYGLPSLTWSTGPAGPVPNATPPAAPAAFYSPYAANVAEDALGAAAGPGSEGLQGFKDNTFIYEMIRSQL